MKTNLEKLVFHLDARWNHEIGGYVKYHHISAGIFGEKYIDKMIKAYYKVSNHKKDVIENPEKFRKELDILGIRPEMFL